MNKKRSSVQEVPKVLSVTARGKVRAKTCAGYSDYDDIRGEISSLFEKKATGVTLFDLVEKHLKEKGMKPSEAYRNAQISKQDFARYVRLNADS